MIGLWKGLKQPFEMVYDLIKLLNHVQTWAEKAGEQALTQALAPAAPVAPPVAPASPIRRTVAPIRRQPAANTAGSVNGSDQAALQQKLTQMVAELRPHLNQVTTGFMPAMEDVFKGGGGITYADVKKKLGSLLAGAESALQTEGNKLAGIACKSFLDDKNDAQLGEDIGDVSGQVLFEVILFVLTEGLIEALKPLQGIAKMLDFVGEAFNAALKWLGKLGGWVVDGVKGLWKFVENSGIGKKVVGALDEIGAIILRYADELMGLFGKKTGREAAEAAGEKGAKEAAEAAGEKGAKEGVEEGGEKAAKETAEELRERPEAIATAKAMTAVNESARVPVLALMAQLNGLKSRYSWLKGFDALPFAPGHFRVIMRTEIDDDYKDPSSAKAIDALTKTKTEAFTSIEQTRKLLDANPTLKAEFEAQMRTIEKNWDEAAKLLDGADAETKQLLEAEFANLEKQAKELAQQLEAKGARPVTPTPREQPAFIRENRAPLDAETVLGDPARFTDTGKIAGGRHVFTDASGNAYYVDRFHKGTAAEIEKFASTQDGAKHLGTITPEGATLDGPIKGRTLSFDR